MVVERRRVTSACCRTGFLLRSKPAENASVLGETGRDMIKDLNHITIAVSDIKRSVEFYGTVLGLRVHVVWETGAYLTAGTLWLCLSVDQPCKKTDYTHFAFTVDPEDFLVFCEALISKGVKQWKENSSEGDSLYFLDPDGHKLEIHMGNLESRLEGLRKNPYRNLEWL